VATESLKVLSALGGVVKVGHGCPGAVWLLQFGAAHVDPLAADRTCPSQRRDPLDPQDAGSDILPGQRDFDGDVLSAATYVLSRRVQLVWS
jgi:hypothetical protein